VLGDREKHAHISSTGVMIGRTRYRRARRRRASGEGRRIRRSALPGFERVREEPTGRQKACRTPGARESHMCQPLRPFPSYSRLRIRGTWRGNCCGVVSRMCGV
jgi:hypothetical protein